MKSEQKKFWKGLKSMFYKSERIAEEKREEKKKGDEPKGEEPKGEANYKYESGEDWLLEDSAMLTYRYKPISRYIVNEKKSDKLAQKLDNLMVKKKLYLDPQLSLTKLGVLLGVNRTYMSNVLKEKNGFKVYVNTMRLEYFCTLLKEFSPNVTLAKKTVTKMALKSGFSDLRTFKRLVMEGGNPWSEEIKRRIYSPLQELEEEQTRQLDRMGESENLPLR